MIAARQRYAPRSNPQQRTPNQTPVGHHIPLEGTVAMKKVKAASIVLDYNLYPRHQVDSHHVAEICEAMRAGVKMPPCITDRKSKRAVDGFHRIMAELRTNGADAMIEVEERTYKTDADLFLDAMRLNAAHGRRMSPYDRTHAILIADQLGIDETAIAGALSLTEEKVAGARTNKTALTGNGKATRTAIKRTIGHMAGKKLNKRQQEANRRLGGMNQTFYVNQVIELLEAKLLDTENEDLMNRLAVLGGLIDKVAAEAA